MKRRAVVVALIPLWLLAASACTAQPTEEELAAIAQMRSDLGALQSEIRSAEEKNAKYAGGLVKALIELRLETLKNTEALMKERILALESGARIEITVPGTEPDPDLAKQLAEEVEEQERKLEMARQEAARYSGGLVAAMKSSTVATSEQTLAMLNQRRLAAKYGLHIATVQTPADSGSSSTVLPSRNSTGVAESDAGSQIVEVRLLRKQFTKQKYQEYIFFDLEFTASGLDKPARAIKGVLHLQDLFGEAKMNIGWTIEEPVQPLQTVVEKGTGFEYNQFKDAHQWVRSTELEDMTASMTVRSILYQDGTRVDIDGN